MFDDVKYRFHDDIHNIFLFTIPTLLFKFLTNKEFAHIIEPRPSLTTPAAHICIKEREMGKKFLKNMTGITS